MSEQMSLGRMESEMKLMWRHRKVWAWDGSEGWWLSPSEPVLCFSNDEGKTWEEVLYEQPISDEEMEARAGEKPLMMPNLKYKKDRISA